MPDTAGLGELWIAVSRLRERCEVRVDVVGHPPGWAVVIAPNDPDTRHGTGVSGVANHLVAAMADAVNKAQARGL